MARLIAGVDEAGRGPVIGPLVIAGVLIPKDKHESLRALGVKDSKLLTPAARTRLDGQIRAIAEKVSLLEVDPKQIDDVVMHGTRLKKLNFLEAQMMARVIADLAPDEAYVDASDVKEWRYGQHIRGCLPTGLRGIRICSEHYADRTYPAVSAASIIAKVRRDEVVADLRKEYGDFGSGYITPKTLHFLRDWRRCHSQYPPIVRVSWKTISEIEAEMCQGRLDE